MSSSKGNKSRILATTQLAKNPTWTERGRIFFYFATIIALATFGFWYAQYIVFDYFITAVGSSPLHWIQVSLDESKSFN